MKCTAYTPLFHQKCLHKNFQATPIQNGALVQVLPEHTYIHIYIYVYIYIKEPIKLKAMEFSYFLYIVLLQGTQGYTESKEKEY